MRRRGGRRRGGGRRDGDRPKGPNAQRELEVPARKQMSANGLGGRGTSEGRPAPEAVGARSHTLRNVDTREAQRGKGFNGVGKRPSKGSALDAVEA